MFNTNLKMTNSANDNNPSLRGEAQKSMGLKLNITYADSNVKLLSPRSLAMLEKAIDFFSLKSDVTLFETIHGHIAVLKVNGNHHHNGENVPARLGSSEFSFVDSLEGFRWIEAGTRQIQIGFTDEHCFRSESS